MNVIERIASACDEITPQTIRRSLRKLVPIKGEDEQEILPSNAEFTNTFRTLGCELEGSEVQEWLESYYLEYEHLSDNQIIEHVEQLHMVENDENTEQEEDDYTDCQIICPVSNGEAMIMFDKCLIWLRHQPEASPYNTSGLSTLKELDTKKEIFST